MAISASPEGRLRWPPPLADRRLPPPPPVRAVVADVVVVIMMPRSCSPGGIAENAIVGVDAGSARDVKKKKN